MVLDSKSLSSVFGIVFSNGAQFLLIHVLNFRNVLSVEEYASYFENIDPLAQYKNWTRKQTGNHNDPSRKMATINDPCSQRVKAVFIVSDSVDWSRDVQVFIYHNALVLIWISGSQCFLSLYIK